MQGGLAAERLPVGSEQAEAEVPLVHEKAAHEVDAVLPGIAHAPRQVAAQVRAVKMDAAVRQQHQLRVLRGGLEGGAYFNREKLHADSFLSPRAAPLVSCVYHTIRARGLQTREALGKERGRPFGRPLSFAALRRTAGI